MILIVGWTRNVVTPQLKLNVVVHSFSGKLKGMTVSLTVSALIKKVRNLILRLVVLFGTRAVIWFLVTLFSTLVANLLLYGWILSTTSNCICSVKGKSIMLNCNRCYRVAPLNDSPGTSENAKGTNETASECEKRRPISSPSPFLLTPSPHLPNFCSS